jgi:hypothetical protein
MGIISNIHAISFLRKKKPKSNSLKKEIKKTSTSPEEKSEKNN